MKYHSLLDKNFRQGSGYKLLEWHQLSQSQQKLIINLQDDTVIYGAFESVTESSEHNCKVAYLEVAMLYLHLQHNYQLPHFFIAAITQNKNKILAQLLLDDIIEIEWHGSYVSGAKAVQAIYGDFIYEANYIPDYLTDLSLKAIYYAWMLSEVDNLSLSKKLYAFNTLPWDASMQAAFTQTNNSKEFLFSEADEACRKNLSSNWNILGEDKKDYWIYWDRILPQKIISIAHANPTCKLYLSPVLKDLPAVFSRFIFVITDSEAFSFKVGNSIKGLLRPDKLVAYFYDKEAMLKTADILAKQLEGYSVQGVPFTAQLDANGLISCGEDPQNADIFNTVEAGSWRTIITDKLALAILHAKKNELTWPQTMHFIHARLLTVGIDSYSWGRVKQFN